MQLNSWDACVQRYETLLQHDHWSALAKGMLLLIDKIRRDLSFPPTTHLVSHAWLRIGPPSDDPMYRPSVWVGWRQPNYYWMGIGSFGTQRRVTVTADRVIPMLKRYLTLLPNIDPEFVKYGGVPDTGEAWSKDALTEKFAALSANAVLPTLAEEVTAQNTNVRVYAEQLRDVLNSLDQMEAAQTALDEILKRAERISELVDAGLERYHAEQDQLRNPLSLPWLADLPILSGRSYN